MYFKKRLMLAALLSIFLLILFGCGGSGGAGEQSDDELLDGTNVAPQAYDQSYITSGGSIVGEDGVLPIVLKGSDADNDTLTYIITTQPSHGTLSGTAPNLTYTPNTNYNGNDHFTFKVNDGKVDSAEATVSIRVIHVNKAPIAHDDNVTTMEGKTVSIEPLLNDGDGDGGNLSILSVKTPAHGKVLINDNKIYYAPHTNKEVIDSFSYTISDGQGGEANATIHVHILPVNDKPVVHNQTIYVKEEQTISFEMNASDPDGDPLTYTIKYKPENGILGGKAPKMSYTPRKDFNGKDYLVYYVNDGTVDSYLGVITFVVTPLNDPPHADAGADYTGVRGDIVTFDASKSYDIDGNITAYEWREGNRTLSTQKVFSQRIYKEGLHSIILTVTDNEGVADSDEKIISMKPCCKGCVYPDPTQTNPYK